MEKKINSEKKEDFAFAQKGKESIRDRIKSLFKGRSLRRVSLDWDLPYSTLNNYFSRSATPSVEVLIKIAELENVSLAWLATGNDGVLVDDEHHRASSSAGPTGNIGSSAGIGFTASPSDDDSISEAVASFTWSMIYKALSPEERASLISLFMKVGARGILDKMSDSEADRAWESLSASDKDRLIRLNEQLKKGSSEGGSGVAEADLHGDSKKVG